MMTFKPLRPQTLLRQVASKSCGAVDMFVGMIRSPHEGRRVRAVTYKAHAPLAKKTLRQICAEAEKRFGARVRAAHRLGRLPVGQMSVAVAAAAEHRAAAFSACRYVIEQIKIRLPVWKKEHYTNGDSAWLDGCSLSL